MKTSKQSFKKKAAFVMLFVMSAFVLTVAQNPRMIITNPGENASTEMRISWHTDVGISGNFVEYTK